MRVEPDEKFIKALDRELQIFNYFIDSQTGIFAASRYSLQTGSQRRLQRQSPLRDRDLA